MSRKSDRRMAHSPLSLKMYKEDALRLLGRFLIEKKHNIFYNKLIIYAYTEGE